MPACRTGTWPSSSERWPTASTPSTPPTLQARPARCVGSASSTAGCSATAGAPPPPPGRPRPGLRPPPPTPRQEDVTWRQLGRIIGVGRLRAILGYGPLVRRRRTPLTLD